MRVICFPMLVAAIIVTGCSQDASPPSGSETANQAVDLAPALGGLKFDKPVALVFPAGSTDAGYIVEQSGRVLSVSWKDGEWKAREFLNLEGRVNDRGREGRPSRAGPES